MRNRKFKLPRQQDGQVYLTSHRICYVDKEAPRKHSVALDLKAIERYEFYVSLSRRDVQVDIDTNSIISGRFPQVVSKDHVSPKAAKTHQRRTRQGSQGSQSSRAAAPVAEPRGRDLGMRDMQLLQPCPAQLRPGNRNCSHASPAMPCVWHQADTHPRLEGGDSKCE